LLCCYLFALLVESFKTTRGIKHETEILEKKFTKLGNKLQRSCLGSGTKKKHEALHSLTQQEYSRQVPTYRNSTTAHHLEIMNKIKSNRGNVRRPPICKRCGKLITKDEPRRKGGKAPYHLSCFESTFIDGGDD